MDTGVQETEGLVGQEESKKLPGGRATGTECHRDMSVPTVAGKRSCRPAWSPRHVLGALHVPLTLPAPGENKDALPGQ